MVAKPHLSAGSTALSPARLAGRARRI